MAVPSENLPVASCQQRHIPKQLTQRKERGKRQEKRLLLQPTGHGHEQHSLMPLWDAHVQCMFQGPAGYPGDTVVPEGSAVNGKIADLVQTTSSQVHAEKLQETSAGQTSQPPVNPAPQPELPRKANCSDMIGRRSQWMKICSSSPFSKSVMVSFDGRHASIVSDVPMSLRRCDICDQTFIRTLYLSEHLNSHSVEWKTYWYLYLHCTNGLTCNACSVSFADVYSLESHLKMAHCIGKKTKTRFVERRSFTDCRAASGFSATSPEPPATDAPQPAAPQDAVGRHTSPGGAADDAANRAARSPARQDPLPTSGDQTGTDTAPTSRPWGPDVGGADADSGAEAARVAPARPAGDADDEVTVLFDSDDILTCSPDCRREPRGGSCEELPPSVLPPPPRLVRGEWGAAEKQAVDPTAAASRESGQKPTARVSPFEPGPAAAGRAAGPAASPADKPPSAAGAGPPAPAGPARCPPTAAAAGEGVSPQPAAAAAALAASWLDPVYRPGTLTRLSEHGAALSQRADQPGRPSAQQVLSFISSFSHLSGGRLELVARDERGRTLPAQRLIAEAGLDDAAPAEYTWSPPDAAGRVSSSQPGDCSAGPEPAASVAYTAAGAYATGREHASTVPMVRLYAGALKMGPNSGGRPDGQRADLRRPLLPPGAVPARQEPRPAADLEPALLSPPAGPCEPSSPLSELSGTDSDPLALEPAAAEPAAEPGPADSAPGARPTPAGISLVNMDELFGRPEDDGLGSAAASAEAGPEDAYPSEGDTVPSVAKPEQRVGPPAAPVREAARQRKRRRPAMNWTRKKRGLTLYSKPQGTGDGEVDPGNMVEVLFFSGTGGQEDYDALDAMVMKVDVTVRPTRYYVHFKDLPRRHDRWVTRDEISRVYRSQLLPIQRVNSPPPLPDAAAGAGAPDTVPRVAGTAVQRSSAPESVSGRRRPSEGEARAEAERSRPKPTGAACKRPSFVPEPPPAPAEAEPARPAAEGAVRRLTFVPEPPEPAVDGAGSPEKEATGRRPRLDRRAATAAAATIAAITATACTACTASASAALTAASTASTVTAPLGPADDGAGRRRDGRTAVPVAARSDPLVPGQLVRVLYETTPDGTHFICPAKILAVNAELSYRRYHVRYLGWQRRFQEWVTDSAIRSVVGSGFQDSDGQILKGVVVPPPSCSDRRRAALYGQLRPCSVDLARRNVFFLTALRPRPHLVNDRRIAELKSAVRRRAGDSLDCVTL